MSKIDFVSSAGDTRDLSAVELCAHTQTPVVAIDRRWCFAEPVTLHVAENPFTHKIKVRNLASTGKTPLLEIRRIDSSVGDLFHVFEVATQQHVLTVGTYGFRGRYDVYAGLHEQGPERVPGLFTAVVTRGGPTTIQFQDLELRRPSRVTMDGGLRDRVALVSVHHGVAWQPIARINRPEHSPFKPPFSTLEVAPGVDMMLPLVMWLSRWAVYELEQRIGVRPTSSPWWGQPNPGTSR